MLLPKNFVLVEKGIDFYRFFINGTLFCLVWNSIAVDLFMFMCNFLDLSNSINYGISILMVYITLFVSAYITYRMSVSLA